MCHPLFSSVIVVVCCCCYYLFSSVDHLSTLGIANPTTTTPFATSSTTILLVASNVSHGGEQFVDGFSHSLSSRGEGLLRRGRRSGGRDVHELSCEGGQGRGQGSRSRGRWKAEWRETKGGGSTDNRPITTKRGIQESGDTNHDGDDVDEVLVDSDVLPLLFF